MQKTFILILLTISLTSITLSCQRISTAEKGELKTTELANPKEIPLEYGSLISVTTHAAYPGWAHLWFEDDDRTIRIVRVGTADNRLHEKTTIIPRN